MEDYLDQLYELDELLELEAVDEFRRRRVIKRRNPFEYYSEEEFEQRYRLTKGCATDLLKRVSHHLPTSLNRRGKEGYNKICYYCAGNVVPRIVCFLELRGWWYLGKLDGY